MIKFKNYYNLIACNFFPQDWEGNIPPEPQQYEGELSGEPGNVILDIRDLIKVNLSTKEVIHSTNNLAVLDICFIKVDSRKVLFKATLVEEVADEIWKYYDLIGRVFHPKRTFTLNLPYYEVPDMPVKRVNRES